MAKTRAEIDEMYLGLAATLESDFFRIVKDKDKNGKIIGQHRVLKKDLTIEDFNALHGEVWRNHEAELEAEGLIVPPKPDVEPTLAEQISELKARIEALEKKELELERLR